MASQKQQYTILYGRLSQEDERAGESNSILHQRELLESYAQAKGFENTLFLADDGYSGTNFERPSWKKIIEMIEAGEVSMEGQRELAASAVVHSGAARIHSVQLYSDSCFNPDPIQGL